MVQNLKDIKKAVTESLLTCNSPSDLKVLFLQDANSISLLSIKLGT